MQYYAVGLYIPIIAKYMISEDKLGVLFGTAIVNVAGIIGAYLGAQYTYRLGTRKLTMIGFGIVLFVMIVTGLFYNNLPMVINTCLIALFYSDIQVDQERKVRRLVHYHSQHIYVHKRQVLWSQ